MLRAGQSLPPKGLSTLRFDAGRFPPTPAVCYRASWQLPGPDSHRLADTSLRVDYLNATTSKGDITSRTHAAGHTKLPLEERSGGADSPGRIGSGRNRRSPWPRPVPSDPGRAAGKTAGSPAWGCPDSQALRACRSSSSVGTSASVGTPR